MNQTGLRQPLGLGIGSASLAQIAQGLQAKGQFCEILLTLEISRLRPSAVRASS